MMGGTTNPIWRHDPNIIATEIDGKPLLLHVVDWKYMSFDEIGGRIWSQLDQPIERDALLCLLLDQYGGDEMIIARDLDAFLSRLAAEGFLIGS